MAGDAGYNRGKAVDRPSGLFRVRCDSGPTAKSEVAETLGDLPARLGILGNWRTLASPLCRQS